MPNPADTKTKGALAAFAIVCSVILLCLAAYTAGQRDTTPAAPPPKDERAQCWDRGGTTLSTLDGPVCIDRRAVL